MTVPTVQKTWTELLGKREKGDELDGRSFIRPMGKNRYKVLWIFDTEAQAEEAYNQWSVGR